MGGFASPPISPVQNGDKEYLVIGRDKGKIKNAHREEYLEVKTMANCETCKGKDAHAPESVPYIVHESSMARMERQVKRLWIALLVAIAMIAATNAAWLVYESQFDTFEYSYEQDGSGTNIIGDGNDVNNGAETEG